MTQHITASPLTWPDGWKREWYQERSRFGKWNKPVSIAKATDFALEQLRMMGHPDYDVIISTDLRLRNDGLPYSSQRDPDDRGASVWWKEGETQRVIALDKYDRIADNIYAIGKTLEALRGIERWGGGEILNRTFTGFTALPDPDSSILANWRRILGDYQGHDLAEAKRIYQRLRAQHHPDRGGDADMFRVVNKAWEQAQAEL